MQAVFIYALNCPITGKTRYIGKTKNPETRVASHICSCAKETNHRAYWIRSLLKAGLKPVLEIVDEVPFEHWPQLEVAYIEFFRERGCDLVNGTTGGEDPPSWKGRKHSPEVCARIGAVHKGRKRSLESRAKQSASKIGTKRSPTACAAISAGMLGRKVSAETCAKLKISCRGYVPWSKGKKFSPEYCAKISAGKIAANKKKKKLWQTNLLNLLLARQQPLV